MPYNVSGYTCVCGGEYRCICSIKLRNRRDRWKERIGDKKSVNLSRWNIGVRRAKGLALLLEENETIEKLNLSNNSFGWRGAKAIGEALAVNKTLRYLDLSNNFIDNEGLGPIIRSLAVNNTLESLILSGVPYLKFSDKLISLLNENTNLRYVALDGTWIRRNVRERIYAITDRNFKRHHSELLERYKSVIHEFLKGYHLQDLSSSIIRFSHGEISDLVCEIVELRSRVRDLNYVREQNAREPRQTLLEQMGV